MKIKSLRYVSATDLFDDTNLMEILCNSDPDWTWGDTSHTMIDRHDLQVWLEQMTESDVEDGGLTCEDLDDAARAAAVLDEIHDTPDDPVYVDLES